MKRTKIKVRGNFSHWDPFYPLVSTSPHPLPVVKNINSKMHLSMQKYYIYIYIHTNCLYNNENVLFLNSKMSLF